MSIVVGANIGRGVSAAVARRNIVKIRRAFHVDPLVLWQEIDEADTPDEHGLIRKAYVPHYAQANFGLKEPISVPLTEFDLVHADFTKIMDGVARSKPGPASPTRFISKAIVVPKGLNHHHEVAVLDTHFPNFEPNDPRWKHCLDALIAEVHAEHQSGRTVIWEGDLNANRPSNVPKVHPKERRVHATANDFMGIVPGSTRVVVHGKGKVNLTIDGHDAIWMRAEFKAA